MKLMAQDVRFPIVNIETGETEDYYRPRTKHSPLFPNSIRALICGPSSCGKTNLMLHLLISPSGLVFENVYVYSKSLYQPKYCYLSEIMSNLPEVHYETFEHTKQVIAPEEARKNSVFIFDDVICDKQENMMKYFSMGRHNCVDCFYLSQTYAKVPKHLIRDNANLIIAFRQDETNLRHIHQDHVSPDITFSQFQNICNKVWNKNYSFITIDKECDLDNGRFRKGFDHFIDVSSL
jgi:Poxvirus A32 protein